MLRTCRSVVALLVALALPGCGTDGPHSPELTGTWAGATTGALSDSVYLLLSQHGTAIIGSALYQRAGTAADAGSVVGSMSGNSFSGTLSFPGSACATTVTVTGTAALGQHPAVMPAQLTWGGGNACTAETGTSAQLVELSTGTPAAVATVTVLPSSAALGVGHRVQLAATARDAGGRPLVGRPVTWASGAPGIVHVSATGLLTGETPGGPVTITAASDGAVGTATIMDTAAAFDHNAAPFMFALTGAHTIPPRACVDCHADGVYVGKSTICVDCHQPQYLATTTPVHSQAGYPTSCEFCHNTATWIGATFNHNVAPFTFYLVGLHAMPPQTCASCHSTGVYRGLSGACVSCHRSDYDRTSTAPAAGIPPHAANGFATTCADCHGTAILTWTGGLYDHGVAPNTFPLTGGHAATACAACHPGPVYRGLSILCYSCHKSAYDSTTSPGFAGVPPHATQGYVTTCESCHTTSSWLGATGP